jgi:hypothetical protein
LNDTLLLRRAHSVGHARQHLNLITYVSSIASGSPSSSRQSSATSERSAGAPAPARASNSSIAGPPRAPSSIEQLDRVVEVADAEHAERQHVD